MKLLWKLLKENISKAQLIGFFIANLIGMSIILIALQFYFDINPIFNKEDKLSNRDYFTISKKVSLLDAVKASSSGFTTNEIDELKNASFIKSVGAFTSSQFTVYTGISQSGISFGTEMFFESIPQQFIDVDTKEWIFSPLDNAVPIILPRNYLDLYNFGFAEARSMPKLTEGMIGLVNLDIVIRGNGQQQQLKGRIVGFSNRINTILVPESFIYWANEKYGNGRDSNPARLIAEIKNVADPNIAHFFKEKGYQIEGDNGATSRMASLLKTMVTIVVAVGIIICILSFIILTLSIYLLLEKNMEKLRKLRLLGYAKSVIVRPYELLVIGINLTIYILSIALVVIAQSTYSDMVKKVWSDFDESNIIYTSLTGMVILLLMTLINISIISRKVQ